ncbi:N-acetyltransferase family protein [Actinoplanes sp. CA-142083]|uniref:GNAT family N-acetyltransferase n=1 Tax=Actinoplanes sp. CA-142083 TaxID=3239903 RepID=UPI003D8C6575
MLVRRVAHDLTERELYDAAGLLERLVAGGAALGWVDPPPAGEVRDLLTGLAEDDDAVLVVAGEQGRLHGLGYWRRYDRPTHRPHADVEKVAVDPAHQGRGLGRRIMIELIAAAREAGVEVLTLDQRGDNLRAAALYESLGFRQYGRLERFVAVGDQRWDKLFYALRLAD